MIIIINTNFQCICINQLSLFTIVFKVSFNVINPKSPAINDELRITNLALFIIVSLSNASKVTKIDMVNPIPPNKPTPKIVFQLRSPGSLQNPNFTDKNDNKKMPNGFPAISPRAIPRL